MGGTSTNERLRRLKKVLEYTSLQVFTDTLGIKQGCLPDVYRAKNATGVLAQIKIALSKYGVNIDWLDTGEGEMLKSSTNKKQDKADEGYELFSRITEDRGHPYYDIDFLGGYGEFVDDPASASVAYMIDYPPYNKEGVLYINVRGIAWHMRLTTQTWLHYAQLRRSTTSSSVRYMPSSHSLDSKRSNNYAIEAATITTP